MKYNVLHLKYKQFITESISDNTLSTKTDLIAALDRTEIDFKSGKRMQTIVENQIRQPMTYDTSEKVYDELQTYGITYQNRHLIFNLSVRLDSNEYQLKKYDDLYDIDIKFDVSAQHNIQSIIKKHTTVFLDKYDYYFEQITIY